VKIGAEGSKYLNSHKIGVFKAMDLAKDHHLEGITFKTVLDLSPSLDAGELRAVKQYAGECGLYMEIGLGKINPFNTPEAPEVRKLGEGDFRRAFERMVAACRSIDCTDLCVVTANYQYYPNRFAYDRFRTDVDWADQLAITAKFITRLAPCLRDLGCRLNIETHEEITSFEVVRLVESAGPDVAGITFDTGNVLARGEDPVAAARRVAPYAHSTHIKDAILFFDENGLVRQPRPCGEGILDWETILPILAEYSPNLNLTLEDHKGLMPIEIYSSEWIAAHPDLNAEELASLVHLAQLSGEKIHKGKILDPQSYEIIPWEDQMFTRMEISLSYLQEIIRSKGLSDKAQSEKTVGLWGNSLPNRSEST
jgi:sugar phosphate isomerase/epimerase